MSETTLPAVLRRLFLDRYDELKVRLTQRLGSADLATEVLQDTWLRLSHREPIGPVRDPVSYLFRMVLNVVQDRKRSEKRHLSAVEIENLLHLADTEPNPAEVAEARSDLRALALVLAELPPRRREILLAARLDDMPRDEIAARFGISPRLVFKELRLAHEYCLARMTRLKGR
jgi:RNA polymerase sigma-70 factor (ECF subfamily)